MAVWKVLTAERKVPSALNCASVLVSRFFSWLVLGAFSASTITLMMLSISMPLPIPVMPAMVVPRQLNDSFWCVVRRNQLSCQSCLRLEQQATDLGHIFGQPQGFLRGNLPNDISRFGVGHMDHHPTSA